MRMVVHELLENQFSKTEGPSLSLNCSLEFRLSLFTNLSIYTNRRTSQKCHWHSDNDKHPPQQMIHKMKQFIKIYSKWHTHTYTHDSSRSSLYFLGFH